MRNGDPWARIELRGGRLWVDAGIGGDVQKHVFDLAELAQRTVPPTPHDLADAFPRGLRDVVHALFREVHRIRWHHPKARRAAPRPSEEGPT